MNRLHKIFFLAVLLMMVAFLSIAAMPQVKGPWKRVGGVISPRVSTDTVEDGSAETADEIINIINTSPTVPISTMQTIPCKTTEPAGVADYTVVCADGDNWEPGNNADPSLDQGTDDWIVIKLPVFGWAGLYNLTDKAWLINSSLARVFVADGDTNPGVNDDVDTQTGAVNIAVAGYIPGDIWINDTASPVRIWYLIDNTDTAAVWVEPLVAVDGIITTTKTLDIGSGILEIPNTNADPDAVGQIRLDTTVSNYANGALRWHDGTAIKQAVDMIDSTAEACADDQVVAYDTALDGFYCKDDAGAAGGDSVSINSGAVVDPDFVSTGDIAFVDASNTITANLNDDVIDAAEMADADHGDVAWSSGVATVQAVIGIPFPADPGADRVLMWDDSETGVELAWSASGTGDLLADGSVPMTGELTVDELGIEFQETDGISDCSGFSATGGGIFYDDSEGILKKCQDNVLSDLDTDQDSTVPDPVIGDPDSWSPTASDYIGGRFIANADGTSFGLPALASGMGFSLTVDTGITVTVDRNGSDTMTLMYLVDGTLTQTASITSIDITGPELCAFLFRSAGVWEVQCGDGTVDGS